MESEENQEVHGHAMAQEFQHIAEIGLELAFAVRQVLIAVRVIGQLNLGWKLGLSQLFSFEDGLECLREINKVAVALVNNPVIDGQGLVILEAVSVF